MRILISGAAMAGLSAAYWFGSAGHDVTVVEQAPRIRRGGAPIDVRGDALGTARRMGILDALRAGRVPEPRPCPVVGPDGTERARFAIAWFGNECPDDIEITRDRLNDVLRDAVGDRVRFAFGTEVTGIEQDADGVTVTTAATARHGSARHGSAGDGSGRDGSGRYGSGRYDMVIGADGLHSAVRRLVFGDESRFVRHLGLYVALVSPAPGGAWSPGMYNAPGRMATVRDDVDGALAMMMFRSPALSYDFRDVDAQRAIVRDVLAADTAWQVPRLREAFADPGSTGFYFDSVSQTHMPRWHRGRVVLLGDAAHCAALLSGMGTSLAMTGAEFLADAVHGHGCSGDPDGLAAAFAAFEARQRPLVDKAQRSVGGNGDVMVPATAADLDRRNAMLREAEAAAVS